MSVSMSVHQPQRPFRSLVPTHPRSAPRTTTAPHAPAFPPLPSLRRSRTNMSFSTSSLSSKVPRASSVPAPSTSCSEVGSLTVLSLDGDMGGTGETGTGGRTSACATPPKKSVMSVERRGLPKRSVRTPGCERMMSGLYESNCVYDLHKSC